MLKARLWTAMILIPLVLAALFFLPPWGISIIVAIVCLLAAWEWGGLFEFSHLEKGAFLVFLSWLMLVFFEMPADQVYQVMAFSFIFWLVMFAMVLGYSDKPINKTSKTAASFVGLVLLMPFWIGMQWLAVESPLLLLSLLLLVWAADLGAYFGGKFFGQKKLIPKVSPNKTWFGLISGFIALMAVAVGLFYTDTLVDGTEYMVSILPWAICSTIIFIAAVVGDLFESLIKRMQNVKDSGTILPGHGGMLDRIDSLLAATPVFVLAYMLGGAV